MLFCFSLLLTLLQKKIIIELINTFVVTMNDSCRSFTFTNNGRGMRYLPYENKNSAGDPEIVFNFVHSEE